MSLEADASLIYGVAAKVEPTEAGRSWNDYLFWLVDWFNEGVGAFYLWASLIDLSGDAGVPRDFIDGHAAPAEVTVGAVLALGVAALAACDPKRAGWMLQIYNAVVMPLCRGVKNGRHAGVLTAMLHAGFAGSVLPSVTLTAIGAVGGPALAVGVVLAMIDMASEQHRRRCDAAIKWVNQNSVKEAYQVWVGERKTDQDNSKEAFLKEKDLTYTSAWWLVPAATSAATHALYIGSCVAFGAALLGGSVFTLGAPIVAFAAAVGVYALYCAYKGLVEEAKKLTDHDKAVADAREALGLVTSQPSRPVANAILAFHSATTVAALAIGTAFRVWFRPMKNIVKASAIVAGMVTSTATGLARGLGFALAVIAVGVVWGALVVWRSLNTPKSSAKAEVGKGTDAAVSEAFSGPGSSRSGVSESRQSACDSTSINAALAFSNPQDLPKSPVDDCVP